MCYHVCGMAHINNPSLLIENVTRVIALSEWSFTICLTPYNRGARCISVVKAFAHGAMGRRIDSSWGGHIELFLVPASAPRLV